MAQQNRCNEERSAGGDNRCRWKNDFLVYEREAAEKRRQTRESEKAKRREEPAKRPTQETDKRHENVRANLRRKQRRRNRDTTRHGKKQRNASRGFFSPSERESPNAPWPASLRLTSKGHRDPHAAVFRRFPTPYTALDETGGKTTETDRQTESVAGAGAAGPFGSGEPGHRRRDGDKTHPCAETPASLVQALLACSLQKAREQTSPSDLGGSTRVDNLVRGWVHAGENENVSNRGLLCPCWPREAKKAYREQHTGASIQACTSGLPQTISAAAACSSSAEKAECGS